MLALSSRLPNVNCLYASYYSSVYLLRAFSVNVNTVPQKCTKMFECLARCVCLLKVYMLKAYRLCVFYWFADFIPNWDFSRIFFIYDQWRRDTIIEKWARGGGEGCAQRPFCEKIGFTEKDGCVQHEKKSLNFVLNSSLKKGRKNYFCIASHSHLPKTVLQS
jgi:hypothetical protein